MPADPVVMAQLQAAHNLEATASERWHKQEHAFKNALGKYPKLGKYFDRRHKEAYQRQHDLRKHIMRLGGTVETDLGDTSYTDDVKKAFDDACDVIDDLRDKYDEIRQAAKEADDRGTCEAFHGVREDLDHIYHKGEQRLRQLKDLGLSLFLSQHL